jgi:peptide/nickel transport system substrate-binding protein
LTEWNWYLFFQLYYDTLVGYDVNGIIVPRLAESWNVSADRTTWTFNLVHNATWHDGVPFTSKDVSFTYRLINESSSYFVPFVSQIESISTPDNYTVVIKVNKPYAASYLLEQFPLNVYIMPEHIFGDMTFADALNSNNRVGTGAFKFVSWTKGQSIVFETNRQWFHTPRPVIDRIIFVVFGTSEAMVTALKVGQIDVVGDVPPEDMSNLQAIPEITVVTNPQMWLIDIAINVYPNGTGNPTLRDKAVRVAMAYAVNKTQLLDVVMQGMGTLGDALVHGASPWHDNSIKPFVFNLAIANAILDAAGYTKRDVDGTREAPDGTRLEYTLLVCSDVSKQMSAAEMIQGWWKQIGIKLDLKLTDGGTISDLNYGSTGKEFAQDMFLWSWEGTGSWDPTFMLYIPTTFSIGSISETGYSNPEYDQLYLQQMITQNVTERHQIVDKMQEILYDDVPYIILYYPYSISAYRNDKWTNVPRIPAGIGPLDGIKVNDFFYDVTPVGAATTSTTYVATTSASYGLMIGVLLVIVLAAAAIVYVRVIRKKKGNKQS